MEGFRLGPYQLLNELGRGGMGKVFRAEVIGAVPGLEPGCAVALKVIHAHLLETPGFFERFLREADLGRTIEHENVVRAPASVAGWRRGLLTTGNKGGASADGPQRSSGMKAVNVSRRDQVGAPVGRTALT